MKPGLSHCHPRTVLGPAPGWTAPDGHCVECVVSGNRFLFIALFACQILCAPWVEFLQLRPAGFQSQMLWGLLFPKLEPQAGEPDLGLRTFTPVEEFLWLFSTLWGIHQQVWDLSWLCPLLPFHFGYFFVFRYRILFRRFQHWCKKNVPEEALTPGMYLLPIGRSFSFGSLKGTRKETMFP